MRTLIKASLLILCTILLVVGLVQNTDATLVTRTGATQFTSNGIPGLMWSYTWAASQDSFRTSTFKWEQASRGWQTTGQVVVESSTLNGDSISLCVRYEVSWDNVNWQQFTLGTDSTTFATTLSGTSYKVNVFDIEQATHGGNAPYCRFTVFTQSSANLAGTKIRIRAMSNGI